MFWVKLDTAETIWVVPGAAGAAGFPAADGGAGLSLKADITVLGNSVYIFS